MRASSLFLSSLLLSAVAVGADLAPEDSSQSSELTGAASGQSAAFIDQSEVAPSNELALATDVWPLVDDFCEGLAELLDKAAQVHGAAQA